MEDRLRSVEIHLARLTAIIEERWIRVTQHMEMVGTGLVDLQKKEAESQAELYGLRGMVKELERLVTEVRELVIKNGNHRGRLNNKIALPGMAGIGVAIGYLIEWLLRRGP